MLSRVADNLYWMARYLERTENLARLVDVSAGLMLDLPQGLSPGWQPLVKITGNDSLYAEHVGDYSEKSAVKFIVADEKNPGSMITSIARARDPAARGVGADQPAVPVRGRACHRSLGQAHPLRLPRPRHHRHPCPDRHVRGYLQRRRRPVVPDARTQYRTRRHDQPHRRCTRRRHDERAERRRARTIRDRAVDGGAALAVGLSDVSPENARARLRRWSSALPAGRRAV